MIVERIEGTAGELHQRTMPTDDAPRLWILQPRTRAVVMGSSQRADQFLGDRLDADHIELAERRSGGGAVYIEPAQTLWIDVLAPRTSPLWSDELAETFKLVGRRWLQALATLGISAVMCDQPPTRSAASSLACWAGIGWGEVSVAGSKVVGLSQRRTRWGARIQSMAVLDDSAVQVARYLGPAERSIVEAAIPVDHAPVLAAAGLTTTALEAAVLAAFDASPR